MKPEEAIRRRLPPNAGVAERRGLLQHIESEMRLIQEMIAMVSEHLSKSRTEGQRVYWEEFRSRKLLELEYLEPMQATLVAETPQPKA